MVLHPIMSINPFSSHFNFSITIYKIGGRWFQDLGKIYFYIEPVDVTKEIVSLTGLSNTSAKTFSDQIFKRTLETINLHKCRPAFITVVNGCEYICNEKNETFSFTVQCSMSEKNQDTDYTEISIEYEDDDDDDYDDY